MRRLARFAPLSAALLLCAAALLPQRGVRPSDALPGPRVHVVLTNRNGQLGVMPFPAVQEWTGHDGRRYRVTVTPSPGKPSRR